MSSSATRFLLRIRPVRLVAGEIHDGWDGIRGRRDPLVPPRRMAYVGDGEFRATGDAFKELFVELGGLAPDDDVLDVGSGNGRIAVALTSFVTGRYEGFDVVASGVDWCRRVITPRFPNFTFQRADLYSRRYNRGGTSQAADYRFPYGDDSFDFVFLTSVFTHLLPDAAANYVREVARVLRPGGNCFATFFILDRQAVELIADGRSSLPFATRCDGYRSVSSRNPEIAIAYDEQKVRDWFSEAGLESHIFPGDWPGREDGVSYQDVVVAGRAA